MNDLRSRLAALTPEQRARLLERVRAEKQGESAGALATADRSQLLPLSFAQRRIWFLEQLDGRSPAYNMPAALRLRGAVDAAAVIAAIAEIVCRHEVLRTRLVEHDGEPRQVIDAPGERADGSACRTVALDHLTAADRDEQLRALLELEARHLFDLAEHHPIRALLVRLAPAEHVLMITLHHVAGDGWSTGVLIREFCALYGAFRVGAPSPLSSLPVQYADFAAWQSRQLADERVVTPQVEYWRGRLAGAPGVVDLPTDSPRGRQAGRDGGAVYFALDTDTATQVTALAREAEASTYMVLLAAFIALLHRWSGDTDITVGSPIANRPQPELEGLIGFFVNTLALRVTLEGDPDFVGLARRVRATALDAYAHAELPFEQIVEKLNPDRRLDRSPFFQLMFAMQSGPPGDVRLDGLEVEPMAVATGAARLDMTLSLQETAAGVSGCLEYATPLFRHATAQRFAESYRNLLAAALRQPSTPVSRLEYLAHGERHRLLTEWNRTDAPSAGEHCLHELVEAQAARTPGAIALRHGTTTWTYAELMARSGRIAGWLQQQGVGPDTLVGVCMERTPNLIAALLGVLRAGGAYVALDPAYPEARTRFVLADSRAAIVLTDDSVTAIGEAPAPRPAAVHPSHLAYVLYTSGSTGQPKGVAIEHRSPVALLEWAQSVWTPAELRGVLAGTSICFDLSVFEIFLPLSIGGAVILADTVLDLATIEGRSHVTLVNTVPSAIDALLHQRALPSSVRVVNLAGEPLTTELADRIYDVPTVDKVFDLYGPSEDTTYSTFALRRRGDAPTIGRPIANTRLYILDRAMQPVPPGLPGEIYLAGRGLARGYLGRPDLTAERFVPSPFPGIDRLYRTGDRARFRDDGNVEFLGRFDYQVKLRGFRIELGEIEAALRAFPEVGQCVVTVEESRAGQKRLIGYVAHPGGEPLAAAMQAHVRARLPEYMVPAVVVVLDALPLTPNGKIDRKALPSPDGRGPAREARPLTVHEARLAAIWQALLGVDGLQGGDDFFARGGHSLLAAQLVSRVRDEFAVQLPLRAVFEFPALHDQAAAIARLQRGPGAAIDVIPVLHDRARLPLSFAQERLWFLDQLEPGSSAYNMAGAIRLRGSVDIAALARAFDRIVDRHETLRTVFRSDRGRPYAIAGPRPVLRQVAALGDEQTRAFDLAGGPLVRALAAQPALGETVLSIAMHHIVSDGWSVDRLLEELCLFYAAGNGDPLPALPVQYADFAAWQRERHRSGALDGQLAYWREVMRGAPLRLELPTDRPRPDAQSYQGAAWTTSIDATLTQLLAARARELQVTPFMALLGIFAAALNRWSGADDLVIGFPAGGRSRTELEPLIGMFVNTVPVRLQLEAEATFEQLLAQTKTRTLDALAHQDVPFEKLVDELQIERTLAWSPLFQVMFVMQDARRAPALPGGVVAEPLPAPPPETTKFDLTLAIAALGDSMSLAVEYDRALFDASTIERFAGGFVALLRQALDAPSAALPITARQAGVKTDVRPASSRRSPLEAAEPVRPVGPVETTLVEIWREVLRLDRVGVADNYFEAGGDSLLSIQVIARLRDRGWRVTPKDIFRHQTIRALAAIAVPVDTATPDAADERDRLPLSPIQRLFFALDPRPPDHFNQALLLAIDPEVDHASLETALREVQRVHPALRSRFDRGPSGWEERHVPQPDLRLEVHDTTSASIEATCQALQRSLDLAAGPVCRAALFRAPDATRLFLVAHHLVIDAVSWRVLLDDLESAYVQARAGQPVRLPAEYCGTDTSRRLQLVPVEQADLPPQRALDACVLPGPAAPMPAVITATLDGDECESLVSRANLAYTTNTADLLLAALAHALCAACGRDEVVIDVEGHGRDALSGADLSRSIGWFTVVSPVRIVGRAFDPGALIRETKEATRAARPAIVVPPLTDVSFNYLGQAVAGTRGGLIRGIAPEPTGDPAPADLARRYRLDVNASVTDGVLHLQYSFDAGTLPRRRVEEIAGRTLAALRALVAHCAVVERVHYTPSDFPSVQLGQDDLDTLLDDLDVSGLSEV